MIGRKYIQASSGIFKTRTKLLLGLGTLLILSFVLFPSYKKIPVDSRPNIIYIMADDLGYSDLGCYGGEVNTPNLDQLAANGIKLRKFYNNSRCCPTRASLLTGQYPHTVGMGGMVGSNQSPIVKGSYQGFLNDSFPTVAEELKKVGYNTYMSGKWHVGERPEHWPLKRGFDRYYGLISGASSFFEITPAERDKRRFVLDDKDYEIPKEGHYMTDAFTDHAMGYLDQQKKDYNGKPFFLYLAYTAPHFPLHALEQDIAKYESIYMQGWDITREKRFEKMKKLGLVDQRYKLSERPDVIPAWENTTEKKVWARKMAVYAAMIDRMDQNIGRLINKLKANGQYDNTMIVFISDNGACAETVNTKLLSDPEKKIGERGSYHIYGEGWANASNTPFKKYKHYMHEGGIVTPCIIQWPAKIKPSKGYSDGIGHVVDLMPTALELSGAQSPNLAGKSLSYLWKSGKAPERTYCWEHEGNQAIRKGNWKLVKEFQEAYWSLYNLATDPTEMNDLSGVEAARAKAMLEEYTQWSEKVGVRPYKKGGGKAE
jgi:arylsulfatase A-like enzyme